MRTLLLGTLAALCVLGQDRTFRPVGQGGRRLALVIGNQHYDRKPLRNPLADARAMRDVLQGPLGFHVDEVEDAKLPAMQKAIREFVRQVRPGDLVLFYYSGHGMQVNGTNWLLPVDFHADFEDEVPDQGYPAQRVLKDLTDAGASVRILILDACRDNPLPASARRGGKDGLIPMTAPEGSYLLFATAENQTASDNPRGANGLFTSYLLGAIRKPGITLDQAFKETRREVAAATNGKQRPWLSTDIDEDVVLLPGKEAKVDPLPVVIPVPVPTPRPQPGDIKVNPKDGLNYVWIPVGHFQMGCSPGDQECWNEEKPAHDVTITNGFWLGQTPVTQRAYQRVTGSNPSHFKGADLPVETVNWDDAHSYCEAIGGRLPTEAEWEYAARAGSQQSRYGSLDAIAWYDGNSGGKTHEVARKQPNAWGLYDMLGNVWQWVGDWYASYAEGTVSDPSGPRIGRARALRGGSWSFNPRYARVSYRFTGTPETRYYFIGFRCVGE